MRNSSLFRFSIEKKKREWSDGAMGGTGYSREGRMCVITKTIQWGEIQMGSEDASVQHWSAAKRKEREKASVYTRLMITSLIRMPPIHSPRKLISRRVWASEQGPQKAIHRNEKRWSSVLIP